VRRTRGLWISVLLVLALVIASIIGFALGLKPTLGLDLEGGVSIILKAPDGTPASVMQQALENIRRRVDSVGVAEPDIFLSGTNIEVQLPGLAKGTIVNHPKDQYCAIGPDATTKLPTSFGCFAAQDDAQSSFDAVKVQEKTQTVCIVDNTGATTSSCFDTQSAADTALKALAAQKQTTGDNAGKYCVTGGSAVFTCFATQKAADAAKAAYTTKATSQFCLTSTSPNLALPCFTTKAEADAELAGITVTHETAEHCVVSSAGVNLGCYLTLAEAQAGLQQTGQQKLLQLIGTTARLEEREVLSVLNPGDAGFDTQQLTCDNDPKTTTPDCPATPESLARKDVWFMGQDGTKYHLGPVQITGDQISKATGTFQQSTTSNVGAQWVVDFNLTSSGANTFANVTRQLVGKQLAIILDAKVISAPVINEPITGGRGTISGSFTEQSAKDLATVLNAGALPVQLQRQQVETVSPTLGQQSLHQGILAGVAGLIALFLYLLFYYRLLGVVAWLGMSIWAILAIALISVAGSAVGYALSLAGIAGLVISLGVTADSYIVFFERLKDEVRSGKSPRSAVQPAFKRAYKTIVAADSVTGIAAVVLYITAVSSVRGFALTLGVATLLDLFVVYFFKRPTVFLIARNERLVNLKGFGLTSGVAGEAEPEEAVPAPVAGGAK
jgi:preprotein translocase subunit SecD